MDGASSTRRVHTKGPGRKPDSEVVAATLRNRRARWTGSVFVSSWLLALCRLPSFTIIRCANVGGPC